MLLETLVEQVEAKFPAVIYRDGKGSRAEAAAELVRGGRVEYLGDQGGRDWWNVAGHRCSIKGGCDCNDAAPLDPNGRKLCKHRLAVMFVRKLHDDHGLVAILRGVQGDRVTMVVQVLSVDTGDGRQYTLNSYRADGADTALDYADRLRFTEAEFAAALRVTGWGMTDRPVKLPGLNHRYILKRGAESVYTPRDTTAQEVEQKEREKRLREITVADEMDAELTAEAA
jgi:hypothetical protein